MSNSKVTTILLGGILIALASIAFINEKQKNGKGDRSIYVEGNVEREVIADTADWTMCFEHIGTDQQELDHRNSEEKLVINKVLLDKGISQGEIEMYNYVREDRRRNNNNDENSYVIRYRVGYFVHIKTDKLALVAGLKNNISKMLGGNFGLVQNTLKVSCSKQEEINQELAKLAAANAMEKAKDMTKSLKLKLKKIITIEEPNFWTQSSFPEIDTINGFAMSRKTAMLSPNSNHAEDNASDAMMKQKVHASIKMRVSIK